MMICSVIWTVFLICTFCQNSRTELSVENSFTEDEPMDVDVVKNVNDGNVFFCPICKGIILDDVKTFKAQSVQCDKCHLWFHFSCVHVTKTALKDKKKWFCPHCKSFSFESIPQVIHNLNVRLYLYYLYT